MPEVQKATFAESENFRAIYNIAPILPGHVLIVPKNHLSRFTELDEGMLIEMVLFSRRVIQALEQAFNTNSFDWTIQDGIPAGQTIEHLHLHIIPRTAGDLPKPGDWYPELEAFENSYIDSHLRLKISARNLKKITENLSRIYQNLFNS